ncbi:enhancer of filamentation 1 isoform X2 [Rana temporaria]|uniref:enhancer of filamentation 1 isoform X2 n=1 Tax=Rana temporaria TaxID=8407 RepID=UPI001AAE0D41|nr:enhancer of filamentation 1 isoform X2 [Rana temporaria]
MNLMARALYDNVPECAEELSFRKGDILTVIEQNTGGLEGWWLCSLHGRQGIAPGNRLKLLIGPVTETPRHDIPKQEASPQPGYQHQLYQSPKSSFSDPVYQVPPSHHSPAMFKAYRGHDLGDVKQGAPFSENVDGSPGNKAVNPIRRCQGYNHESASVWQASVYDIPPARPQGVYDVPPPSKNSMCLSPDREQGIYDVPPPQAIYNTLPPSKDKMYDFPSSMKQTPEATYDTLPPSSKTCQEQCIKMNGHLHSETPPRKSSLYDFPRNQQNQCTSEDYDFPRGVHFSEETGSFPDDQEGIYDFPPQVQQDCKGIQDATDGVNRLSFSSTGSTRSNMSTSSTTSKESSVTSSPSQDKKLLMDPDSAIELLLKLQQMVESSVSKLLTFVNVEWRSYSYMERHINEIHSAVDKVKQSLFEFLHFSKGAGINASCVSEPGLYNKMKRELQRLDDSHQILTQTSQELNNCNWSLNVLSFNKTANKCDSLERFIMVARTIVDDAKQITTTVSINAVQLFKHAPANAQKRRPSDVISSVSEIMYSDSKPHIQDDNKKSFPHMGKEHNPNFVSRDGIMRSWMDDYDYVHLQGKEEFERHQRELLEKENIIKHGKPQLEQHQLSQFQQLEQEITTPMENDISKWKSPPSVPVESSALTPQDKQLLSFYSEQCERLFISLLNSIDAFFNCMSTSQPPRIFVAHSKFVILSAHKLVFIGDTLARQVSTKEICNRLMNSSNQMCELLKSIVMATKMAALNYPSSASLQEMVDRVTELSNQAQLFKLSLAQMSSL